MKKLEDCKEVVNRSWPNLRTPESVEFKKKRLLALNTPLPGANIFERAYYAVARTIIHATPSEKYYQKMLNTRYCECNC